MDRERDRGTRRDPHVMLARMRESKLGAERARNRRRPDHGKHTRHRSESSSRPGTHSHSRRLPARRSLRATRPGWCFIAIVFGVGFAALNTGNNLLYLVLALLLAFLVLSGLLSEASLRGLRIERVLPNELFAGHPNRVVLRIHNQQRKLASFAVTVEDRLETDSGPESAGRCFVLRIGAVERCDRSYVLSPAHRGEIHFSGLRASTRFPFGLFVKSVDLDAETSALAYPEILTATVERERTFSGEDDATPSAEAPRTGDEIGGLREWVAGDPMQRIHWRRSLRAQKLVVGEREGDGRSEIEVLLRLPATLSASQVEQRVSRAASEVVAHLEAGLAVGLRSREIAFPATRGHAHRTALLTHLARVGTEPPILESPAPDAIDHTTRRRA